MQKDQATILDAIDDLRAQHKALSMHILSEENRDRLGPDGIQALRESKARLNDLAARIRALGGVV